MDADRNRMEIDSATSHVPQEEDGDAFVNIPSPLTEDDSLNDHRQVSRFGGYLRASTYEQIP